MKKPYFKEAIRCISYFLYVVFVGCVIFLGSIIELKFELLTATTGNNTPQFILMLTLPVVTGILLAIPGFIAKLKSNGNWKIDWAKLMGIGLPAFYITIYPFLYFVVPRVVGDSMFYSRIMMGGLFINNTLHTIGGLVFGYLILSAIHKKNSE